MKRRPILVATGLILVAFGVGVRVGSRFTRKPAMIAAGPVMPAPSDRAAQEPAAPVANRPPPCVDIHHAEPLVGKTGCVAGLLLKVYTTRTGTTFLDFCQDYRTCPFTSVIFASNKSKFGDLGSLQGKRVEIRGNVVTYQGHTEIVILDPEQIRGQ